MMDRRYVVAFALIAIILVVSAVPVSAVDAELEVGSVHTTPSDFEAGTLTNMTVTGTGTAGAVESSGQITNDTYESGTPLSQYTIVNVTGAASWSVSNGQIHADQTADGYSLAIRDNVQAEAYRVESEIVLEGAASNEQPGLILHYQDANNQIRVRLDDKSQRLSVSTVVSGSETLYTDAQDWVRGRPYRLVAVSDGTTLTVEVYDTTTGEIVASKSITIPSELRSPGGIGLNAEAITGGQAYWEYLSIENEGANTGSYVSGSHSVANAESYWADVDVSNADVTIEAQAWTGTKWIVVNSTTVTSSGNYTLDISGTSYETWRTNISYTRTGDTHSVSIQDEGILFNAHSPTASGAKPAGGTKLSSSTTTFSVNVNDTDLGLPQGDAVTATLYIDGAQRYQTTITSNGTVSTSKTLSEGGQHTYHWVLTDSYGESTTTSTKTITVPATVEFRNVTNTEQLVNNTEVDILFFYGDNITARTTTDGTIDLSGLPVDQPIIIQATANGYYDETVVLKSIYEQSTVFMLPENETAYYVRFDLQDPRGEYPREDTVLRAQRPVNVSGNTSWMTVAGDQFGVAGTLFIMKGDVRHRLIIENLETGDTAGRGVFVPIQNETVTLSTGTATISFEDVEANYTWSSRQYDSNITFEYVDQANKTQSLKLTIHERYNKSNVLVDNATFTDLGTLIYTEPLTANESNMTWTAEIYIDRGNGYMHFTEQIGSGPIDLIPGSLSSVWRNAIGVFITLISSMIFSQLNSGVGAVATGITAALLWYLGFLALTTTGPAVVFALAVSVVYQQLKTRGVV